MPATLLLIRVANFLIKSYNEILHHVSFVFGTTSFGIIIVGRNHCAVCCWKCNRIRTRKCNLILALADASISCSQTSLLPINFLQIPKYQMVSICTSKLPHHADVAPSLLPVDFESLWIQTSESNGNKIDLFLQKKQE